ncbi:MAG: cobalamin-dependent protein [Nitrosopumilus sp.]|nr:cobalamin-dependent protein [Nitrosopumilus sp.]MDH3735776.1 cobalamin-dependent protein [Nitrosopumilus sp.]MDH3822393.1 cobalamin-dependent protein [Nitrosopumilus sp.]MDH3833332.1 cobalamin-dependent protein [Nitrosopumilus sp.]
MVYIRAKKVKGDQYLYLVKSVWDSKKSTSKQEIVKYLGKASEVIKDDIPVEYRENPKILSVLAAQNPEDIKKREEASRKSIKQLYKKLTDGDIQSCVQIYDDYIKIFNSADFFDKILRPVMHQIGDEWANNKISIATEHVASNVAQTLVKIIMDKVTTSGNKKKILLCVPVGEEHHLGCDVIETFLTSKGYKVFNMGTSIPSESVLYFIENDKPDLVMVSITLEDNLKAGQRLIKKIKDNFKVPIVVGGYALEQEKIPKFDAEVFANTTLNDLPKLIRTSIT